MKQKLALLCLMLFTTTSLALPRGAPDCIDNEDAKLPSTIGAPGFSSCMNAMPASASARVCVAVPATVTGDMAPARMNGVTMQAWPARAYTFSAPSIVMS